MNASNRVDALEQRNPALIRLATLVSAAARVDPALLRTVRLSLMPATRAGIEGDLWFSPLVQAANAGGFQFYPDVGNLLRSRLATDSDLFDRVSCLIADVHQHQSPLLRLEEEIIRLTFCRQEDRLAEIDKRLLPLVAALKQPNRKGIARWVTGVATRLPTRVQTPTLARLQLLAKAQILGVDFVHGGGSTLTEDEFRDVLEVVGRVKVGVRLREDRLELFESPAEGSQLISVPAARSRSVEVTWRDDMRQELVWPTNEAVSVPVGSLPGTIRTLSGERYLIRSRRSASEQWNDRVRSYFVTITDQSGEHKVPGFLVDEHHVVTADSILADKDSILASSRNFLVQFPLLDDRESIPATVMASDSATRRSNSRRDPPGGIVFLRLQRPTPAGTSYARGTRTGVCDDEEVVGVGLLPEGGEPRLERFRIRRTVSKEAVGIEPAANIDKHRLICWSGTPMLHLHTGKLLGMCRFEPEPTTQVVQLIPFNTVTRSLVRVRQSAISGEAAEVRRLRVFVSSPGDVVEERRALNEVVDRINRTDGRAFGVHLDLWKWEHDIVPQIGPRSQNAVEAQSPPDYDVYLGIVAHRFGTPTGRYGAGTEREFSDALRRWRKTGRPWILFYFKTSRVDPDQVDPAQLARVREFREKVQDLGLYATYDQVRGEAGSFIQQVDSHLRRIISSLVSRQPAGGRLELLAEASVPETYRAWVSRECSAVELLGLQEHGRAVQLYQVYVPLTIAGRSETSRPGRPSLESDSLESVRRAGSKAERKPELLLDVLAEASLYVEGGPGSGRSTFCRWVAYAVNAGDLPPFEPETPEGYVETFPETLRHHLPLLIPLRDFWTALPDAPAGSGLSRADLEQALHRWLDEKQPGQLSWPCVRAHLERGQLLIMLDSIDEVPIRVGMDSGAYHPRQLLLEGLADAVPRWTGHGNRVLVTSRPYGLNAAEVRRLGLRSVTVAELDDPLQALLVRRWFHALSADAEQGARNADEMRAHLSERADAGPLVSNPMLLTALCVIFNQGKRLPRDKHELYDRILDNVLHNRYGDGLQEIPLVRNLLSVVAYGMHTGAGLEEDRETPQAEATTVEIERMLQRYRDESPATEPGFRGAAQTCDDLLTRSGVLLPRPGKRAGFYHFSFQDFLAAQLVLERESDLAALFRRRAARQEWRSTLSFVFTSLLSRSNLPDKAIRLLVRLIEPLTLEALPLAVVVADCLEVLAGRGLGLQERHVGQFRQLCLDAIEREVQIQARVELGLALGRLGDPRIVEDLRDHTDARAWVKVPGGKYILGGDQGTNRMKPINKQEFTVTKPFLISRFPVTNAQFRRFVDDGGYQHRDSWSEEGWQWREKNNISEPVFWRDARWNGANQRVVGVSFWEAEAFACWADCRLPNEFEWDAAARGPQGYMYPWGDDWQEGICSPWQWRGCNPIPVGIFPRSRSNPFGVEDLAGGVWEWCADDEYDRWGYVHQVVRQGCREEEGGRVYSFNRNSFRHDYRTKELGFRLVSAMP